MFENIGGKIKGMAKFFCWAGIILSVIIGIIYLSNSNRYQDLTTQGIIVLIVGPLCSWLGSLMTYGFGELIERAKSIDEKLSNPNNTLCNVSNDASVNSQGKQQPPKVSTKPVTYDDLPDL